MKKLFVLITLGIVFAFCDFPFLIQPASASQFGSLDNSYACRIRVDYYSLDGMHASEYVVCRIKGSFLVSLISTDVIDIVNAAVIQYFREYYITPLNPSVTIHSMVIYGFWNYDSVLYLNYSLQL
jgi:hypothetical protein